MGYDFKAAVLGSNTFSVGPSAVVVAMPKHWVIGAIANQQWSIGNAPPNQRVNAMLIQPFINYNLPEGWYLTSAPIITANWEAFGNNSSDRWVRSRLAVASARSSRPAGRHLT